MSWPSPTDPSNARLHETLHLRKCWPWFLVLGSVLILLGLVAIGAQFVATLTTVLVFGILLVIGGVVQIVNAVLARGGRGFFVHLLAGVLHLIVGGLMVEHPLRAAEGLTLMLAAAFLLGGSFRIIFVLSERFPGWPWVLVNGVITLLLGIAIWRQWPESSLWVIGLFVGIDLVFNGWSWVMLALAVRAAAPGSQVPEPTLAK